MYKLEALLRDVVQRASAVAEVQQPARRIRTIGERAAIALAEKERLAANRPAINAEDGRSISETIPGDRARHE